MLWCSVGGRKVDLHLRGPSCKLSKSWTKSWIFDVFFFVDFESQINLCILLVQSQSADDLCNVLSIVLWRAFQLVLVLHYCKIKKQVMFYTCVCYYFVVFHILFHSHTQWEWWPSRAAFENTFLYCTGRLQRSLYVERATGRVC